MLAIEIIIIVAFLIYCFVYACRDDTSYISTFALYLAPVLVIAFFIPLIQSGWHWLYIIVCCILALFVIVWYFIFVPKIEKHDIQKQRGSIDKDINIEYISDFYCRHGFNHPEEVLALALEPGSPFLNPTYKAIRIYSAEKWLYDRTKKELQTMSLEQLGKTAELAIGEHYDTSLCKDAVIARVLRQCGFGCMLCSDRLMLRYLDDAIGGSSDEQ